MDNVVTNNFFEISIKETQYIGKQIEESRELHEIQSFEELQMFYVTSVYFKSCKLEVPTDTFVFLYSLLRQISALNTSSKFLIEISEEYEIVGEVDQKSEVATLFFKEVDQEIIETLEIGKSELLLELITLVSEFKQSVQAIGGDIQSIVKRFSVFTTYKDFLEEYGFPNPSLK